METDRIEAGRRLIDVREEAERAAEPLVGALPLPLSRLVQDAPAVLGPDRDQPLLLVCAAGWRSRDAARRLRDLGYHDSVSLAGGVARWRGRGLAVAEPDPTWDRYRHHLSLPEIGLAGQRRLAGASVLILGLGGLGSPVALYLAAAGIGRLGLVDHDRVELSNLQRQIIHAESRLGVPKVESAATALAGLNGQVRLDVIPHRFEETDPEQLVRDYDVVVSATDSFDARWLANRVAIATSRPLVDGGVFRFEGHVSTVLPGETACYACRHPTTPSADLLPACSATGVMGVLPGLVGTIQATEVIKLVLGIGRTLAGQMLVIDALDLRFHQFAVERRADCPVCSVEQREPAQDASHQNPRGRRLMEP